MRLQNRLQQAFSSRLKPGEQVWKWAFENFFEGEGNTLVKATVQIPLLGQDFCSGRVPTVRNAQMELCTVVTRYLDTEGYP